MKIYRTYDLNLVKSILNHPKVKDMVADDSTPEPYEPPEGFYLTNEEETGILRIDQVNGICCSVHIAAHPNLWGKAEEFVKSAIEWGMENTGYNKVLAFVPSFNRLTIRLCRACGFEQEGVAKRSILKNWRFHDQILFGLSKTDFLKRR